MIAVSEFKLPKLYSVKETAEIMNKQLGNKSESFVYTVIAQGQLKAKLRRGTQRGYVITEEALMDFFANAYEEKS